MDNREKEIYKVTLTGTAVNAALIVLKFVAGFVGRSSAMVADAVHSLSDFVTDVIVLVFVKIAGRPSDKNHDYGHGKYETFATMFIGLILAFPGFVLMYNGIRLIIDGLDGHALPRPTMIALVIAVVSIVSKEWLYRLTARVGRRVSSNAVVANAWHHRSDALASVATLVGVTFSHFFGPAFRILDPVASLVIAVFIFIPALRLFRPAFAELMERSLPARDVENARGIVAAVDGVRKVTYLRTRRNGHHLIFDVGIGVDRGLTVEQGSEIAAAIERALTAAYCPHVMVSVTTSPA